MGEEGLTEFECPQCHAPVQEDWAACPSCGLEFAPAQEEAAPAPPAEPEVPPAPAPAEPPARTAGRAKQEPAAGAAPPKARGGRAPRGRADDVAPRARAGPFGRLPLLGPVARRVGTLGVVGLGLCMAGLIGYFLVYNYDTLFAGQTVNTIGPNQANFVLVMAVAAAAGGFLAMFGFFSGRTPGGTPADYEAMEGTPASALVETGSGERTVSAEVRAPPRAAPEVPAAAPAAPAVPERAPSPAPAAPAAVAAPQEEAEEEEEEEEDAFELPSSTPPAPAAGAEVAAEPPSISTSDELEDLFGELESEVQAAAEEEEVLYECPNCHGVVKEDDTSCPHCQVVFEA